MWSMKMTITQFGDAPVILLDEQLLKLAQLAVGDQVHVEVQADGTITIDPLNLKTTDD